MKTIYYTASSLDGYIADPANSLDWLLQFGDAGSSYEDFIAGVGALAMGSTTYEWLLAHQGGPDAANPQPWPYKQPTWVFSSRSLPRIPGAEIRFVSGDVRPVYRQMVEAAGEKNIWLVGGGELVGQFHDCGLLDEIVVQVAPVTLGGGAPLFPRAITTPPLRLIGTTTLAGTFAELRYEVVRSQQDVASRDAGTT